MLYFDFSLWYYFVRKFIKILPHHQEKNGACIYCSENYCGFEDSPAFLLLMLRRMQWKCITEPWVVIKTWQIDTSCCIKRFYSNVASKFIFLPMNLPFGMENILLVPNWVKTTIFRYFMFTMQCAQKSPLSKFLEWAGKVTYSLWVCCLGTLFFRSF